MNLKDLMAEPKQDKRLALRIWWMRVRMTPWRKAVLSFVVDLANTLERRWYPQEAPKPIGGKVLEFKYSGRNLSHDVLSVISQRGGFGMGTVEWSNQWNRPRFKAHPEAVFDQQCIAEIYACMREMK